MPLSLSRSGILEFSHLRIIKKVVTLQVLPSSVIDKFLFVCFCFFAFFRIEIFCTKIHNLGCQFGT